MDPISNLITLIRNADMAKQETVPIPSTKITESIVKILLREGFIENVRKHKKNNKNFLILSLHFYRKKETYRTILKRISRPSFRIYSKYQRIPRILGGIGIVIMSTSRGIITDLSKNLIGISRNQNLIHRIPSTRINVLKKSFTIKNQIFLSFFFLFHG